MNIFLILIPMALVIITIGAWFFFWAIKSDQFDDLDRQGANILFDDDLPPSSRKTTPPAASSDSHNQSQSQTTDKNTD